MIWYNNASIGIITTKTPLNTNGKEFTFIGIKLLGNHRKVLSRQLSTEI